jgi:lipopolysaccharide transport system ATP-binding protein
MTKKEITSKLDEIIEFSGCERYIDTPTKRYSSGMTVRLAFAVAAFLEPEILVVDEVLAVGDAEFQKKAIGKMQDISREGGRTVLFVSHNMAAVQSLCTRSVVMQNGTIKYVGETEDAIQFYLKDSSSDFEMDKVEHRKGNGIVKLKNVSVYSSSKDVLPQTGRKFIIDFEFDNPQKFDSSKMKFDFRVDDYAGQRIVWMSTGVIDSSPHKNCNSMSFEIEKLNLNKGTYYVTTHLMINNEISDWIQNAFSFDVTEGDFYGTGRQVSPSQSKILMDFNVVYK